MQGQIHIRWLWLLVLMSLISLFFFPATSHAGTTWMKFFRKDTLLNTYMRAYSVVGDRLWVGTYGDGIVIYNGKSTVNHNMKNTVSRPGAQDGLVSDLITCITVDEKGNRVWIGTNQGLSSCDLNGEAWKSFSDRDGLPNNVIRDIDIDETGRVWIATPSGVCRFDGEKWDVFTSRHGLSDENIQSLKIAGGTVWAASTAGTVSRFSGEEWQAVLYR
jgi:streptogramin lyase